MSERRPGWNFRIRSRRSKSGDAYCSSSFSDVISSALSGEALGRPADRSSI